MSLDALPPHPQKSITLPHLPCLQTTSSEEAARTNAISLAEHLRDININSTATVKIDNITVASCEFRNLQTSGSCSIALSRLMINADTGTVDKVKFDAARAVLKFSFVENLFVIDRFERIEIQDPNIYGLVRSGHNLLVLPVRRAQRMELEHLLEVGLNTKDLKCVRE